MRNISPQSPMSAVLENFSGAQRALFRRYHIGGCSSCGFSPDETLADQAGVALRGGHHCTQPLMHKLGVASTARASFYFYNTQAEVDRFVEVVKEIQKSFGQ